MANESTKANLELFYNIAIFWGCICIIAMLECVQSPSKFIEMHDAFIVILLLLSKKLKGVFTIVFYMPPNSLGDPKVGPKNNKQRRELGHAP